LKIVLKAVKNIWLFLNHKEFGMKERSALSQRIISVISILGLVLALTAMESPVFAAQQAAPADQEMTEESISDEALEPPPASPIEKAEKDGTAIRLSLIDITKLALQNNIDIAIEETNERSAQESIKSAYGNYDPSLSFTIGMQSRKSANTRIDTANPDDKFSTSKNLTWNLQYQQQVRTGGNIRANWQSGRSSTDEAFSLYNPNYTAQASVTYTQPLWKNLKIDQNRGNIKLRKLDLESSDSQFRQTVTTQISRIQQQYWDLVSAIRNYDIQRSAVELAQRNLRDIKKKVEVGTLAPIEITQANYQVAQTKMRLINAEDTIHRQMNNMRQSISSDRNNEIWSQVIVPTDTPDFREYRIDPETAIETALQNRPELLQSDLALKQSDINLAMSKNNRKWGFDLSATIGSSGSAGTPGPGFDAPPEYIGGVGTAYDNLFTQGLINWTLQLTVDIPLRNRAADASLATQQISRQRTLLQRRRQEQQIQVEIRNALQTIETNRQQVKTNELNRLLAQEQLDGEEKRFGAGLSEFYRVLDQQNRLAEAENSELGALIDYKKSIIALQEAMNTLLEYSDFEISKSASEHIPDLY
jgi:outer membrane protein